MYMMVVGDTYALVKDGMVLGVVIPNAMDKSWSFKPIVAGKCNGVTDYITLDWALKAAMAFEPA